MTGHYTISRLLYGACAVYFLFTLPPGVGLAREIKSAIGKNADFRSYKTYQWLPVRVLTDTGVVEDHPSLAPAIKAALNRELSARGLSEVAEGADLMVSAFALKS